MCPCDLQLDCSQSVNVLLTRGICGMPLKIVPCCSNETNSANDNSNVLHPLLNLCKISVFVFRRLNVGSSVHRSKADSTWRRSRHRHECTLIVGVFAEFHRSFLWRRQQNCCLSFECYCCWRCWCRRRWLRVSIRAAMARPPDAD